MDTHNRVEQLEFERARVLSVIDHLEKQTAKVSEIIDQDGLTVLGSKGQPRPHHLLSYERKLDVARERAHALWSRLDGRLARARESAAADAILDRANEITAWSRSTESEVTSAGTRDEPHHDW